MNLLRYVIAAVLQAWSTVAKAAKTVAFEVAEDWFKWGDRAKTAGSHTLVGAGAALAVPGAAIGLLGRMFPAAPVTPAQVADMAVAEDEAVHVAAPAPRAPTLPEMVQMHAAALPQGVDAVELPELPHAMTVWLSDMGPDNRRFLARMPIASIERHIGATAPVHLIRGIDRVPSDADMRQREADVAAALAAMEVDGRMDRMRAETLADMRDDAVDTGRHAGLVPAFA